MSPQPHGVTKELQTALERFGVVFNAAAAKQQAALYDSMGLRLGGVPNIGAWGSGCGRGLRYEDHGPVTDGQKGAIRKISSGRKARGMASDGLAAVQHRLDMQGATD